MPFAKLLEADIGLALVPFLRLQALLRFMAVSQQCSKLALFQLLQHKAPISLETGNSCKTILWLARDMAVSLNLAGLPPVLREVMKREGSMDILFAPCLAHYNAVLVEETYQNWDSLPHSPQRGLFDLVAERIRADDRLAGAELLEEDAKYWKTSRVTGDFIFLLDRADGVIAVSQDMQQVYLVTHPKALHKAPETSEEAAAVIAHGPVLGMMASTVMIPLQGHIVMDNSECHRIGLTETIERALRAYEHAFNTNQLITALPKIPPPERVPVQVPSSAAAIAALRAKHAAAVQVIAKQPINTRGPHSYAVVDIHDSASAAYRRELVVVSCVPDDDNDQPLCVRILQTTEPTLEDYLAAMLFIASSQHARPALIMVDYAQGFHLLKLLLQPHGMEVLFTKRHDVGRQMVTSPRCNVCRALHCADGSPLLRCAACSLICYCSRKHQKEDWKDHKPFCMRCKV